MDFNITCEEVIEKGYINRYYRGEKESIIMEQYFMRVDDFVKRTHCWDYIFDLNSFKNDSYGVYPIVNLVMNIGAYGVHTNASVLKLVKGFLENDIILLLQNIKVCLQKDLIE